MENNNISKADLARKLNKSRAAITQMFNKTPNISILKIVEIADAVGLELNIIPKGEEIKKVIYIDRAVETKTVYVPIFKENWNELPTDCDPIEDKVQLSNSQYGIISSDTSSYNNRIDIH